MRKLLALLIVAAAFTFTACEKKGETSGAADSAKVDSMPAADPMPQAPAADTMAADTTAPAPATEPAH